MQLVFQVNPKRYMNKLYVSIIILKRYVFKHTFSKVAINLDGVDS